MKFIVGIAAGIGLTLVIVYVLLSKQSVTMPPAQEVYPTPVGNEQQTGGETQTSTETITIAGIMTGKICYPSEGVPEGQIEAKEVSTAQVYTQSFPGTQGGGGQSYSFELPEGKYIVRFVPNLNNAGFPGYHTDVCPTGLEATCAQANKRTNLQIEVKSGVIVDKVDLCDYYYGESGAPAF